jgi:PAS domain-containing protein
MPDEDNTLDRLKLEGTGLVALLEAMPAAISILADGNLIHANAAFAYAFGYRSFAELFEAGGLDAIVPGGPALLTLAASSSEMSRSMR